MLKVSGIDWRKRRLISALSMDESAEVRLGQVGEKIED
jgi:hypothetical protein